jgi:hypothetical protein
MSPRTDNISNLLETNLTYSEIKNKDKEEVFRPLLLQKGCKYFPCNQTHLIYS